MVERVTFLIEQTNERVGCLLNPESLTLRRVAGVQSRRSISGGLTGATLADDPLLYSGGGRTELRLDLLFDVWLAGSSITTGDVRDLTLPLWNLTENSHPRDGVGRPPLVRFIWGKSWNILGIIVAIAEHLEDFTPGGTPQRSWLRLQMVRVDEAAAATPRVVQPPPPDALSRIRPHSADDDVGAHETVGGGLDADGGEEAGSAQTSQSATANLTASPESAAGAAPHAASNPPAVLGQRLDQLALHYYGSSAYWRLLAAFNQIDDPLHIPAGRLLRIPPASTSEAS